MAHSLETSNGEAKHLKPEEDGIVVALNVISSIVLPFAVRAATELGIFDILAKAGKGGKLSPEDIANEIGSQNPEAPTMLDRLLRLLTSHSMLDCSLSEDQQGLVLPKRLYSLAPASKYFVKDSDGVSFGPNLNLTLDKVFLECWTELKGAIMEGGTPFNRCFGMHAFEYQSVDKRFNDVFNNGMDYSTTIVMKRVLEYYEGFENVKRLVDVGGGYGIDQSQVDHFQISSNTWSVNELLFNIASVNVIHMGGDMFVSVPEGDAIFMKWILHDWSDEHCLKLLNNCHKAIPNDGKVIVADSILLVLPDSTYIAKSGFQVDLLMMAVNPGGKERTRDEFIKLALGSGFSGIRFVCCVSSFWIMEFFK